LGDRGAVGESGGDAVQVHGQDHHGQAGFETEADVDTGQGEVHVLTEATGADHTGDDDHGQRQHDHLVHATHDGRQCQRHLNLAEDAPRRRPEGLPGLDHFLVHLPDAQFGEPDTGGDTEDHRGDHARYRAGEEDDHHRDEVHKGGHRLQEVQDGTHDRRDSLVPGGPDTYRDAYHQSDHTGDDHQ